VRIGICEFTTLGASLDTFPDSLWDVEAGELPRRAVGSLERTWEQR
jgi:hypothetical protein